jgi:hypothetical protein
VKTRTPFRAVALGLALAAAATFSGCATKSTVKPYKYNTTDRRTIVIGRSTVSNGGLAFDDPHMDKCWTAEGFDFNGYDALYLAPITNAANIHYDDIPAQEIAKENLLLRLRAMIAGHGIFANVVLRESDIQPGAKTLKLTQTIVDYTPGSFLVRHWAGPFAGHPDLRVHGVMFDGDKVVFDYTIRRAGTDVAGLMGVVEASGPYLQFSDIRSMVLDLTDFMAAVAGKYTPD